MEYTIERKPVSADSSDTATIFYWTGGWGGTFGAVFVGDNRYYYGSRYKNESGMRFRKIYIPHDAVIVSAKLTFERAYADIDSIVNSRIYAQESNNARPFKYSYPVPSVLAYENYIGRERLGDPIAWDGIEQWEGSTTLESPDISSLIQALVDEFTGLYYATIVLFWGDIEGRTPAPPAGKANSIRTSTVTLSITFTSDIGIPELPERNTLNLVETDIQDFDYGLDDIEIRNDIRYLIPKYDYELDKTQTPPVMVPIDFIHLESDGLSDRKYGRRTQIMKWHIPNDWGGEATCKANLEKKKEPLIYAHAKVIGKDAETIEKCLSTKLSDIYQVAFDSLEGDFWVDGVTLTAGNGVPEMSLALSQKTLKEGYKIFRLDEDELDSEAVLG